MDGDAAERNVLRWSLELRWVAERIAPRCGRSELRARVSDYVDGLIAGLDRKDGR